MKLRWIPQWYELDWTVVVGDIDWFILSQDRFINGFVHDEDDATKLKIKSITTDDLRKYLADYKNQSNASKSTIDNI